MENKNENTKKTLGFKPPLGCVINRHRIKIDIVNIHDDGHPCYIYYQDKNIFVFSDISNIRTTNYQI